jgi:hypothetical protein
MGENVVIVVAAQGRAQFAGALASSTISKEISAF